MTAEHRIRCGTATAAGDGTLTFEVDGKAKGVTLRVDHLSRRLVSDLPERALDLLEIAAYVYAADAAIPRGGVTDQGLGKLWRRKLHFEVPVRDPRHWRRDDLLAALTTCLGFLSDDHFDFTFRPYAVAADREAFFRFSQDDGFKPDEVLLFSGGLDSFAGALDEVLNHQGSVALVSHQSSTKVQKVQSDLVKALRERVGSTRIFHVPASMQLRQGTNRESTHRTRSFFFAALGIAIARSFALDRVRFHENGVVSLNLPIANQVVGARATRSTHPQVLAGLSELFTKLFERPLRVDNPFIWKTKTEIVTLVGNLGAKDQIRRTRSCADVRERTRMHPHCGLCSQCIDRRVAVLAAGLPEEDPVEGYQVDPLAGPRREVRDREMGLGYIRNARRFAAMTPADFVAEVGEIQRAIAWLDQPSTAAAERLYHLHKRHGEAVSAVVEQQMASARAPQDREAFDPDSLVMLAGRDIFAARARASDAASRPATKETSATLGAMVPWILRFHPDKGRVFLEGLGAIDGVSALVLKQLAEEALQAAGAGLAVEDYPCLSAKQLAEIWRVSEETVRRRVLRVRSKIAALTSKLGRDPPGWNAIVENLPWHGYRLNPEAVRIVREPRAGAQTKTVKQIRPPSSR